MATKKKAAAAAKPVAGGKFKRLRPVTLPSFKMTLEVPSHLTITGALAKSTAPQRPDKDGKVKEPATVCPVTDLETGEMSHLVAGAALVSILNESYPKDSYVGLSFEITKHDKPAGKRYHTYSVFEIEA